MRQTIVVENRYALNLLCLHCGIDDPAFWELFPLDYYFNHIDKCLHLCLLCIQLRLCVLFTY